MMLQKILSIASESGRDSIGEPKYKYKAFKQNESEDSFEVVSLGF